MPFVFPLRPLPHLSLPQHANSAVADKLLALLLAAFPAATNPKIPLSYNSSHQVIVA